MRNLVVADVFDARRADDERTTAAGLAATSRQRVTAPWHRDGGSKREVGPTQNVKTSLAPPASHNANLEPLVEEPAFSLAARHAKVRRDGCAR